MKSSNGLLLTSLIEIVRTSSGVVPFVSLSIGHRLLDFVHSDANPGFLRARFLRPMFPGLQGQAMQSLQSQRRSRCRNDPSMFASATASIYPLWSFELSARNRVLLVGLLAGPSRTYTQDTHPGHTSRTNIQDTHPAQTSRTHTQHKHPGHTSSTNIQDTHPAQTSRTHTQDTHPGHTSRTQNNATGLRATVV
ncbi:hypothetical protein LZ32DRAFT_109818 [Colletotrichum eremochloae]|nr:hypothetical protein LZ32DRAFT_109818 [Colletotrichum eremochloae]